MRNFKFPTEKGIYAFVELEKKLSRSEFHWDSNTNLVRKTEPLRHASYKNQHSFQRKFNLPLTVYSFPITEQWQDHKIIQFMGYRFRVDFFNESALIYLIARVKRDTFSPEKVRELLIKELQIHYVVTTFPNTDLISITL